MSKLWLTRADLRKMIAEDMKLSDDWGLMFPDDGDESKNLKVARKPSESKPVASTPKLPEMPAPASGTDVLKPSTPKDNKPVTKQTTVPSSKGPAVVRGGENRSRYAASSSTPKPAYSKQELRAGADVEPKKPGMIDRVKNMFGFGKKPGDDAALGNVNDLRAEFERYKTMHRSAEEAHDVKKSAYAKKRMQHAYKAWRDAGGRK